MRSLALIAAVGLACSALTTSAVADPAQCTWQVSKVVTPDGYDPGFTKVLGTDSHGNYAGTSLRPGANTNDLILWTGGKPQVVQEVQHLQWLQMTGENSAGTVLVNGYLPAEGRWTALLYSGGHQGRGTLTEVTAPAGYRLSNAIALNERGDVVGLGQRISDGQEVGVLWSALASGPQVFDTAAGVPEDLDDDGTVLLRSRDGKLPGYLWRGGQLTPLADGGGKQSFVEAIRGGKVIGYQVEGSWPESQALLWDRDGNVQRIDQGGTAFSINAGGLITGERDTMVGHEAVWQDTTYLGDLPYPDGVALVSELFVAGDDNTLFSAAGSAGPLRWTCV